MSVEFLRRSIELAIHAGASGNRPFGSVIVSSAGHVLAEGRNEAASAGDVTAHAELMALRLAESRGHRTSLAGSTVYTSGEPCPMCAAALVWAGVGRIVFAASTEAFTPVLPGGPHFDIGCAELIGRCDAEIEVIGPAMEDDALEAMRAFGPR